MEDKIKIINPFTDIPIVPIEPVEVSEEDKAGNILNNVTEFTVGEGDEAIHISTQGIWAGANAFADAPWSVDLDGNMVGGGGGGLPVKYGKTTFADTTNAGFWIGDSGVFIGNAGDTKKVKFTIASGVIDITGVTTVSPAITNIYDLGDTTHFWNNVYANRVTFPHVTAGGGTTLMYIRTSATGVIEVNSPSFRVGATGQGQLVARYTDTEYVKVDGMSFYPTTGAYNASKYYLRTA